MYYLNMLINPLWQTVYMVLVSSLISFVVGIPLGILLFSTRKNQILDHAKFNFILSAIVTGLRSIPFIILMIAIIPVTRFLVGTSIGTTAAIVPLSFAAIPFVARIVETSLLEIPAGLIEAAQSMGANNQQIIFKFLLPESLPSILQGLTLTIINLVAYSAMAGALGGGGLGDLAIRYGYQRFDLGVMIATIVVLIILVQIIQMIGDLLYKKYYRGK